MTGQLVHYAAEPITFDPQRSYVQAAPRTYGTPEGLWVSVAGEDDWPSWCEGEGCFTDSLKAVHHVTLSPDANVLRLNTVEALDDFTRQFAVCGDWERQFAHLINDHRKWPIEWPAVAAEYDGIMIAPYQWGRRNVLSWYYGWDCASGCIWNLAAVAAVELVAAGVAP